MKKSLVQQEKELHEKRQAFETEKDTWEEQQKQFDVDPTRSVLLHASSTHLQHSDVQLIRFNKVFPLRLLSSSIPKALVQQVKECYKHET